MSAYFEVVVAVGAHGGQSEVQPARGKDKPQPVPAFSATVEVISHGGFKGTVDMTYTCTSTSGGTDPTLTKTEAALYVDQGNNPTDVVGITGEAGFSFTACGEERGGSLSDCDSDTD